MSEYTPPTLTLRQVGIINSLSLLQPLCAQFSRDNPNVPLGANPYFLQMEELEEKLPPAARAHHCMYGHGWNAVLTTTPDKSTIPYGIASVECAACLRDDPNAWDTIVWAEEIDDGS